MAIDYTRKSTPEPAAPPAAQQPAPSAGVPSWYTPPEEGISAAAAGQRLPPAPPCRPAAPECLARLARSAPARQQNAWPPPASVRPPPAAIGRRARIQLRHRLRLPGSARCPPLSSSGYPPTGPAQAIRRRVPAARKPGPFRRHHLQGYQPTASIGGRAGQRARCRCRKVTLTAFGAAGVADQVRRQ